MKSYTLSPKTLHQIRIAKDSELVVSIVEHSTIIKEMKKQLKKNKKEREEQIENERANNAVSY